MNYVTGGLSAAAIAFGLFLQPAQAAVVFDKPSCTRALADAVQARNAAQVSNKIRGQLDEMIRSSEELCLKNDYAGADRMMELVRGMAAEE